VDSPLSSTASWLNARPTEILVGSHTAIDISGFRTYQLNERFTTDESPNPMWIKVSAGVESCDGVAVGSRETPVDPTGSQATVTVTQEGTYRLCVKHRREWQPTGTYLRVTGEDSSRLFNGANTCQEYLRRHPEQCGCYYYRGYDGLQSTLPIDTPLFKMQRGAGPVTVNMGCCAVNTPTRTYFRSIWATSEGWGFCKR